MKRSMTTAAVFSIIVILSLAIVPAVTAQEGSKTTASADQKFETKAQELFSAIEEKGREFARIHEQMSAASDEDAKALRKRGAELVIELTADLDVLTQNVAEREKSGVDVAEDRTRVTEMVQKVTSFLHRAIEGNEKKLKELRSAKDDAAAEDQREIDEEILATNAWLDRSFDLLLGRMGAMDDLGLSTDDVRAFLSEHLVQRADLVAGRILLIKDRISRIERRLAVDPTSTEFNTEFDLANERLDRFVERLQTTVRMMESLDLETADYQQLLFEVTGEITTGLFSREVMAGLIGGWAKSTKDWLVNSGPGLILKALLFVVIIFAFRILSRIARKVVRKAIHTSSLSVSLLLERTALSVTGAVVMIFGVLVAFSQLGFEVGPLLAGLGVVGFIVGFALQDTLSNFASGVMILLYRPYDVGDLIEIVGAFGKVKDMNLVSTTILTLDHQTLVVPNSKIWGDVIKNVTAQTERRVDMVFGIGYADDIPHAERVLREIVEAHDKVLDDPEPVVKLHKLGESSVDFIVRPWVATDDYWDVYWDITREVKIRFDAEGISIPFPQRDVHLFQEGGDGEA
jgi:small conductance mechanosensitive channel